MALSLLQAAMVLSEHSDISQEACAFLRSACVQLSFWVTLFESCGTSLLGFLIIFLLSFHDIWTLDWQSTSASGACKLSFMLFPALITGIKSANKSCQSLPINPAGLF